MRQVKRRSNSKPKSNPSPSLKSKPNGRPSELAKAGRRIAKALESTLRV